jgi:heme o synthase
MDRNLPLVESRAHSLRSTWRTIQAYIQLTKPKILVMLLMTAYSGMVVAAGGAPPLRLTLFTLGGLALSSGAGAVLNMWYDRDIDEVMRRTHQRPLPSGRVSPRGALSFGVGLAMLSTVLLAETVNLLTAALSLAGCLYYVVVYTMWLKRRTPQNIVIGGGAGAFPPLVGWAAVTGHLSWPAWLMFAVIFLWTPPHFWALALYKNEDYVRAKIPMMPVVRGFKNTKWQMFIYTLLLLFTSLIPLAMGRVTAVYAIPTVLVGVMFCALAVLCLRESDGSTVWAKRMFFFSLLYIPVWFLAIVVGTHGMV